MPLFITVPFWVSRIHDCANDLWFILYTIYYRDTLALPLFNLTNIHGLKNTRLYFWTYLSVIILSVCVLCRGEVGTSVRRVLGHSNQKTVLAEWGVAVTQFSSDACSGILYL